MEFDEDAQEVSLGRLKGFPFQRAPRIVQGAPTVAVRRGIVTAGERTL
jgi:hypothetical protein